MITELPIVAVLMALYRGDDLNMFEKAVLSLRNQEYPSDKVRIYLCVDGQVPLAHANWLKHNEAMFYRVLRKPENKGLAMALNDLLNLVGDEVYLLRMDGDDQSLPDRFASQIHFMESNPDVDLVGSNALDIDENGKPLRVRKYPEEHDEIIRLLPRLNPVLHPTYCIRASTMLRDQVRYPDAFLTEDWAFLFEVVRRGWRLHNLQTTLLMWRTSETFIQRRSNFRRGLQELLTSSRGILRVFGPSPQLVWPALRFVFRLLPSGIVRWIYRGNLRKRLARVSLF